MGGWLKHRKPTQGQASGLRGHNNWIRNRIKMQITSGMYATSIQPSARPPPFGYWRTHCPNCYSLVDCNVQKMSTFKTHLTALLLFLVGAPCCLCLFPYCLDCYAAIHYTCPRCNAHLGTYRE